MNEDFSKHHEIINNFRGKVNKKSFETNYNAATEHFNKNERFLLKMELKRLAAPCTRAIDLRGLVKGDCQIFDYQGQSHFLDEVAIDAFNKSAKIYGGYTFGVYEAVKDAKNSFRNIYQNEKVTPNKAPKKEQAPIGVEKLQYPAKLHLLNNYPNRAEERMNFAIPVTIKLENNKELMTTTIDLSVSGIKFKLIHEVALFEGDMVSIIFTGLEQEFQFNKDSIFTYEVKNVFRDSGTQLIGCSRIKSPENDGFEKFLNGYVQGNKHRYKINLDNTITALQARNFEQASLVKLNELPIFMYCKQSDKMDISPRYVLTTKNNQKQYQYWQDEKSRSVLQSLISPERFKRLLDRKAEGKELLVFSFTHENKGLKFFYSVDEDELKDDSNFFMQYLAFAASKSTFAVTALNVSSLDAKQAYSPFTLSSSMTKRQSYLNPPLSDEVKGILSQLPYVVTASDVTDATTVNDYQRMGSKGIDLERLKQVGLRPEVNHPVDEIILGYGLQRQEVRFKYKTPVVIDCDSLNWSGTSADFSVSGMKIILDEPATLSKGDIVHLTFPKLQKITSSFDLKQLPYMIMRVGKGKTEINLRVSVKEHQHIGRTFFKLLIDKNKNKLTPDEYAMLTPGLSESLRNLYAVSMAIPSLVIQSSGSRYKTEALVEGSNSHQENTSLLDDMLQLSDRNGFYNLYPVLGDLQIRNILDSEMKTLLATDLGSNELIYIAIKSTVIEVDKAVTVKLASELSTAQMRNVFIQQALKNGKFYCIKLRLSRTDEAHMVYLNPELAYVSSYAIHRGKQLEQEIYSVSGVAQLVDVTQEVLFRYTLPK